ncbi:MAG: TolC family protein [Alphaproteobacteria bacterium]|nr:TolC family protein [Alphaproteobacteria bacterium]
MKRPVRPWNGIKSHWPFAALLAAGLGGCVSVSPDAGMDGVAALTRERIAVETVKQTSEESEAQARARVAHLLKQPLNGGRAVQIALLNNRHLQAAYNELGISEAQFVQAALPPNPTISVARLAASLEREIERQILVNLFGLITQPSRQKISEAKIRQAQMRAASETLKIAAQARSAYYRAVASRQMVGFLQQANVNARTVSQLFKQLGETGAVNKIDQAREHVFYAELAAQLGKARMDQTVDHERLIRALGLWGKQTNMRLPSTLPALPKAARNRPDVEREAVLRNIAIHMAKAELDATILSLGLTNATRFISVLELKGISAYESARHRDPVSGAVEKEKASWRGVELEIQIPIFDFGQSRKREAEETYARAFNLLAAQAVDVRSYARENYARYRGAYDLARHYQRHILPLRKIISDESLLRYNTMIVDILPVLAEARQRVAANMQAINARCDFWLAEADLRAAIVGGGAGGAGEAASGPVMVSAGASGGH